MDSVQADHLPRGWATFVEHLTAHDSVGALGVTPAERGATWRAHFAREPRGWIQLYRV